MIAAHAQILSTRLVADLETPVSAMLKLARNARYSFLLESVEGGAVRGRYSIIGMRPDVIWKVEGSKRLDQPARALRSRRPLRAAPTPPLEALRALLKESRIALPRMRRPWRPASSAIWAMTWCG